MQELTSFFTMNTFAYIYAAVFLLSGVGSLKPPKTAMKGYLELGYPSWWHYVTAIMFFIGAPLLIKPSTRPIGATIIALVMAAAVASWLRIGKIVRAIPAFLLLIGALALLF